ncbi:PKD-like domain-containing protein [Taibaiella sp. KBW10]|uniref:Ig-like domain-containing protein n=1 Tax=Taibaiella sp. KBW10 TaxID=2153357 RepID=UPI000F5B6BD0|nr:PKD-like domain-containing protein [Taibaiella sp. KBW10]
MNKKMYKLQQWAAVPLLVLCSLLWSSKESAAQISTATVTVHDSSSITLPSAATTAASPASFCTGTSTTLSVSGGRLGSGTPAAQWVWYADACPTGAATPVGTGASITVSPTNAGTQPITKTYYVRAEGGFCNINTACVPVTVTINPVPVVTAPANQVYCANAVAPATSLSGTPTGVTYAISGGASVGLANASGLTQIPSFTALNTTSAPVTATVTITPSANGCTGTPVTYTITVNPKATVVATADITKCNGNVVPAISFTSTTTGGTVTYSWTNDNPSVGIAASGTTSTIPSFTATNTNCTNAVANIIVTPIYTNGGSTCNGTPDTFVVTVRPTPNATLAAIDPALCQGTAVQLKYTATCGTGPFAIEIRQDGATPFQNYTGVTNGSNITVTPTPTSQGTHTYDLMKITDANGCSNPVTP